MKFIETLVSLRITHINRNINANIKKSIQNKSYCTDLNRLLTFVFMFPFMFVISKLPINGSQLAKMKKSIPDMSLP